MKKIALLLMLLISLSLFSQKYELGKVTIEELKEKFHPTDTAAVAAILFKKGDVHFNYSGGEGFVMETKVSCKIKIYKKGGYDLANFARRYYILDNAKETLNFSKAYTYNLVDGKIEKTKLKGDGEFDEKINKFWSVKKISMPNVKEGSIIEFEYLIKSPSLGIVDEWEFQSNVPVNYSEFKTFIPEYFVYNAVPKGYILPKVAKDAKKRSIAYSYVKDFQPGVTLNNSNTNRVNSTLEFDEQIITYSIQDIPALKDESHVNNIKNYMSSISHELAMTKYPNENYVTYSTDWETITKKIYENTDFGAELNKTGYFEDDLKTLLSGLSTQQEKIATIFTFVKSKVKWNDYFGYNCDGGVKKAYREGTGNVAEINLMLTAMLRYANINANPVLISTRSNGIALFPNRTAYNYVIAAVEIDNDLILLDATSKSSLPNILPTRDLNWVGRMIRKDGTSDSVDLMPKMISKDVLSIMATIKNDGTIEGKVREQFFDYNGYAFRSNYANLANEVQLERLEKRHKGLEVDGYELTNTAELDKPVTENYSFRHNSNVELIGDKMYFSPLLFFAQSENPFKQETREYPVDFSYPYQDKYLINITIPDGYAVESMPQSASIPMSDDMGSMKYMISNTDKKIQLSVTMDINSAIISPDYYGELKAFFAEVVKKQTEKVVLKKV